MSAPLLAAGLPPEDACPAPDCHPGLSDPCLPLSYADLDGSTIAAYLHECGMAWATRFDGHLWPVECSLAPSGPVRRAA